MTQKLTGPALVAYLRDNPTSDVMRAAADEIERLQCLYEMSVNSVCRELEKHGVGEVNSAAEAIEVLVSDKDKEIARLRKALEMIAGIRPCADVLLGNTDIALAALAQEQRGYP